MAKPKFLPDWTDTPPEPHTYRSIFKWGASDGFKHPNAKLYEMLKEKFDMKDDDFRQKQFEGNKIVGPQALPEISSRVMDKLSSIVGKENISMDDYSRVKFGTGKTMEEAIALRQGKAVTIPDLVVHPRDRVDVQKIVDLCNKENVPVYVYGGGSSVNLGFHAAKGGISLAMGTHMNRIIKFNELSQSITVEPGIMGPEYEKALNNAPEKLGAKHRYTGGHFPQSFEYSSVGGWIVTLGSGQASSYYGDVNDLVLSQEYVTPCGSFKTLEYPGTATGPKVNDIMKGSEGSFGVLVSATLKVSRFMPANKKYFSFIFPSWKSAVSAAREITQQEFGMPAVFRISDPEETDVAMKLYGIEGTIIDKLIKRKGYEPGRRCLCIGTSEGQKDFTKNVKRQIKKISKKFNAMYITGFPVKKWEHGRFQDPYMREDLNDYGVMIDTLETGVRWDNIHKVHQDVREFIKSRPKTVCMTHASHFYPQGTNLYFIFIARMNDLGEYKKFQKGIIDRIEKSGGSLSHHHGVGKMISPWMEDHLGREQMEILRALKKHFDPNGIMNPGGTLGLD